VGGYHDCSDENDLARINAYAGDANQLQELLATIAPLVRPVWFEAAVIGEHGTEMILGCGAVPGPDGSLDIGFACYAPALQRRRAWYDRPALQMKSGASCARLRALSFARYCSRPAMFDDRSECAQKRRSPDPGSATPAFMPLTVKATRRRKG
jgi:hypothetical protein